jgi:hypothetical protein
VFVSPQQRKRKMDRTGGTWGGHDCGGGVCQIAPSGLDAAYKPKINIIEIIIEKGGYRSRDPENGGGMEADVIRWEKVNKTTCLFVGNYLRLPPSITAGVHTRLFIRPPRSPAPPNNWGEYKPSTQTHPSISWPLFSLYFPPPFHPTNVVVAPLLRCLRAILTLDQPGTCSRAFSTASPATPLWSQRTT